MESQGSRRRSLSYPGNGTTSNVDPGIESPIHPHRGYISDAEEEEDLSSQKLSAQMANFRLRDHRHSTVMTGGASKSMGSLLGIKVPSPSFGLSGFEAPTIARFVVTRVGLFRDHKRILTFTKDRVYVVRVDTGFVKESYPVRSCRIVPLNETRHSRKEKFELYSDLRGVKQVYRCKERSALMCTFFDIQDRASRDVVDRLYHAIKCHRQSGEFMLNVVFRVGPGSIEILNPNDFKRNLRAPIRILSVTRILYRVKNQQCFALECKGGAFREYLTLEREGISRAICYAVENLGETPPPIIMSDELPVFFPSEFITRMPVLCISHSTGKPKLRELGITNQSVVELSDGSVRRVFPLKCITMVAMDKAVGIILKLEWGEERAYEMVPCIDVTTSTPSHDDRKLPALFHFRAVMNASAKWETKSDTTVCTESGGVQQQAFSLFGRSGGGCFNLLTRPQAQWLFFSNLLCTSTTILERQNSFGWGLQIPNMRFCMGTPCTSTLHAYYKESLARRVVTLSKRCITEGERFWIQHKEQHSFHSGVPPDSVLLMELLAEVNATVSPYHFRAKDLGPPSLKAAATALLWLIQPQVLKHFSYPELVSLLQATRIFVGRGAESAAAQTACPTILRFLSEGEQNPALCFAAALLLGAIVAPLKFIPSGGVEHDNCRRDISALGKKLFSPSTNDSGADHLLIILSVCFPGCVAGSSPPSLSHPTKSAVSGGEWPSTHSSASIVDCMSATKAVLLEIVSCFLSDSMEGGGCGNNFNGPCSIATTIHKILNKAGPSCYNIIIATTRSPFVALASSSSLLLQCLVDAGDRNPRRVTAATGVGNSDQLRLSSRRTGQLLWCVLLASDLAASIVLGKRFRLLLRSLCNYTFAEGRRNADAVSRSFPPGLLTSQPESSLHDEYGVPVGCLAVGVTPWGWENSRNNFDQIFSEWNNRVLGGELRTAEVIWMHSMREELGCRIRAEIRALDQCRSVNNVNNGERCRLATWNDIAWQIPWHDPHLTGGHVKVGRYFLLTLQEACDEPSSTRFSLPRPALLSRFFSMCLQRLSVESEASVVELILDTMCSVLQCVERQYAKRGGGAATNFEGLALPSLRGIVSLIENGFPLLLEESYKGTMYMSSIRYLRHGITFHMGNARLFLTMNGIKAVSKVMRSAHLNICHYFKGAIDNSKKVEVTPKMAAMKGKASDVDVLKESVAIMAECLLCLNMAWQCVDDGCHRMGSSSTPSHFLMNENEESSMISLMVLLAELLEIGSCTGSEEREEEELVSVLVKPVLQALAWMVSHKQILQFQTQTGSAATASKEGGGTGAVAVAGAVAGAGAGIIQIQMCIVYLLLDLACRGIHPTLCAEVLTGEVLSPPFPTLGLCGRGRALADNPLSRFIPGAMIRLLLTEGPNKFAQVLCMEESTGCPTKMLQTPTLWWNEECRKVLSEIINMAKSQQQFIIHNGVCGEMNLKDHVAVSEMYERQSGMPRPYIVPFYVSQLRVGAVRSHVGPESLTIEELGDEAAEFISECSVAFSNFASRQCLSNMESSFSGSTSMTTCRRSGSLVTTVSSPISSVREVTQLAIRMLKFLPHDRPVISQNLARALRGVINPLLDAGIAIVALVHQNNCDRGGAFDGDYHRKTGGALSVGSVGLLPEDRKMKCSDIVILSAKLPQLEELEIALEKLVECANLAIRSIEPRGELVAAVKAQHQEKYDRVEYLQWFDAVPVALNMADEVLRCLKQLGRMTCVVDWMKSINSVLRSTTKRVNDERPRGGQAIRGSWDVCGLGNLITTMIEFLSLDESAPVVHNSNKLAYSGVGVVAEEGLNLAIEILGRQAASKGSSQDDDDSLLLEPSVHVLLLTQCLQWSPDCISGDDSRTAAVTLPKTASRALQALVNSGNNAEMRTLSSLLTPGLVSVLQQSSETFLIVVSGSGGAVRSPHVVWTACMKQELHEFLLHLAASKYKTLLADKLQSFCFSNLREDPIIGGVNVQLILEWSNRHPTMANSTTTAIGVGSSHHSPPVCPHPTTATLAVQALCLPFPSNLIELVFNRLCDDIEVFMERQDEDTPHPTTQLLIKVKHMETCLRAVLGLAIGIDDGMQWLVTSENNKRRLWLLWELLPPSTEPSNLGEMESQVHRSIIQLAHAMADYEDSRDGYYSGKGMHLLVSSGIACPLLCLSSHLLRFGGVEGRNLVFSVFKVMSGMTRASERFATHLVTAGAIPWIICCLSTSSIPMVTRRECAILLSTLIRGDQVKDKKEGRPRGEVGVERVFPVPLVAHLEADQLGTSMLKLLDNNITAPTLMWDVSCRDKLNEMCYRLWTSWRPKLMSPYFNFNTSHHHHCIAPTSARWTVDDLPDEYPVPGGAEREPCIAGLYFRVLCRQPGFKLEETHVLAFLVAGSRELGSLGLPAHRRLVADLMKSLFCALSTLPPERLAVISRVGGEKLWPSVFNLIYHEAADSMLILSGIQIACFLLAVPGYECPWNEAGAATQFERHGTKATAQLLGSQVIDDQALRYLLMAIQTVVTSPTKESMQATYSVIATPEVLRVLVTRLSAFSAKAEATARYDGVEGHYHGQDHRRRKKSSIFFNKGPSISKGGRKSNGDGGHPGYVNHHRGSVRGTMLSLATHTEFTVLMLLANMYVNDIGGLVTRRFLNKHSHHVILDVLESMKVIPDREKRKGEIIAILYSIVPQVEEFHELYVPTKPVTGFQPTPLPRMLQCLPAIDGSLFSQEYMSRRKSILGPQIVFPSHPLPEPPPHCNATTVVVHSPPRRIQTALTPLPQPPCNAPTGTLVAHSPPRRISKHTSSSPLPNRCYSNSGQKQENPRILMERIGPPTLPWPSPRRGGATKTVKPLESPIRKYRISP